MLPEAASDAPVTNGTERLIDGRDCVYYDGYWIRRYDISAATFRDKKSLIDQLTKRVFHHTEAGINTPGSRLNDARRAYERETVPARKRVNAAMLAGALLNRATDIFTKVVELEEEGIRISPQNELLRECGRYFMEALELGKQVRHHSGEEGLDELWGEPFRAFTLSIEQFYEGRYLKVAQSMSAIDHIIARLVETFAGFKGYELLVELAHTYGEAAKRECEILRSDPEIFQVWPEFVASGEALAEFEPARPKNLSAAQALLVSESMSLVHAGKNLLQWVASARVPMPKSTREYCDKLEDLHRRMREGYPRAAA